MSRPGTGENRTLGLRLRWKVYLRSLALQASWNGQRMQNLGLLATMLPWLRTHRGDLNGDRIFCRRYYEFFNTNPYLANFLIGGLIRLEEERLAGDPRDTTLARTFRDSLARAFASLGDQLFWLGIRPALAMGACLLALTGRVPAVVALVGLFAAAQLALRWISLGNGYTAGTDIVELMGHAGWHRAIKWSRRLGALLTGLVAGAILASLSPLGLTGERALPWIGLALGWALPGLLRKRLPGEGLLVLAAAAVLLLSFAI